MKEIKRILSYLCPTVPVIISNKVVAGYNACIEKSREVFVVGNKPTNFSPKEVALHEIAHKHTVDILLQLLNNEPFMEYLAYGTSRDPELLEISKRYRIELSPVETEVADALLPLLINLRWKEEMIV